MHSDSESDSESYDAKFYTDRPIEDQLETGLIHTDECNAARAEVLADYERRLSPLPESCTGTLLETCRNWDHNSDGRDPTLHYGFFLTYDEEEEIACKLLDEGRIAEDPDAHCTILVSEYLNDRLNEILDQDPDEPDLDFRDELTVSTHKDHDVFTLYTTSAGCGTMPDDVEKAVRLFKEIAPQREPMWYFDLDTYSPSLFKFKPFKADKVVGPGLAPFLHSADDQ